MRLCLEFTICGFPLLNSKVVIGTIIWIVLGTFVHKNFAPYCSLYNWAIGFWSWKVSMFSAGSCGLKLRKACMGQHQTSNFSIFTFSQVPEMETLQNDETHFKILYRRINFNFLHSILGKTMEYRTVFQFNFSKVIGDYVYISAVTN